MFEKYIYLILLSTSFLVKGLYILFEEDEENKLIIFFFWGIETCLNLVIFCKYLIFIGISKEIKRNFTPFMVFLTIILFLDYRFFSIILLKIWENNESKRMKNKVLYIKHCVHLIISIMIIILYLSFFFNIEHLQSIKLSFMHSLLLAHNLLLYFFMILTLKIIFFILKGETIIEEE